jgi:2-dehydro-3-deoxyphosphooctonate aldolase (KDO 8-P synthase)
MIDFDKFFLIAGPCVIESFEHLREVATHINQITKKMGVQWVLKSSYDKANRTSIASYRGPGMGKGMSILYKVGQLLDCPVTTDFHEVSDLVYYGSTVDIVQIPAFLSRQTSLLKAAAGTGKPVNVKKGQFIPHWGIPDIVRKLTDCGCGRVLITERGHQFGYNDVVVDFRRKWGENHWLDVLDVTHTVSYWEESLPLARAGMGVGVNSIFCEVGSTKCDKNRSIPLDKFEDFLNGIGISRN